MKTNAVFRKVAAFIISAVLLMSGAAVNAAESDNSQKTLNDDELKLDLYGTSDTYFFYRQQYENAEYPDKKITVDLHSFAVSDRESDCAVAKTAEDGSKVLQLAEHEGIITWIINVEESGFYYLNCDYKALVKSNSTISFGVLIDGVYPYSELRSCSLPRVYKNEKNDEGFYVQSQLDEWQNEYVNDLSGNVGNILIYLEQGKHYLSLALDGGVPFLVKSLTFMQQPYVMSYQDYLSYYKQQGADNSENKTIFVQAEDFNRQSSLSLTPISDTTDSYLEPFDYNADLINIAGGSQWKTVGDYLSWEFDVKESGFYNLAFKYRQNYLDGIVSSRELLIDGEVPFKELSQIGFSCSTNWETLIAGDGNQNYSIYLEAGKHTVTLKNVYGDSAQTIYVIENANTLLNQAYLSVVMVTGSDPDPYKDYWLEKSVPELVDNLCEIIKLLQDEVDRLIEKNGKRGSETSYIEDVIFDLTNISEDVNTLIYNGRLTDMKNIISGLAEKMIELKNQALDLDYIVFFSSDAVLPKSHMSFFDSVKFQMIRFINSFVSEYQYSDTAAGEGFYSANEDATVITVWMQGSGDVQFEILKNQIQNYFIKEHPEVAVKLRLVSGSLNQAIISGVGPDVVIGVGADGVVNLSLRGALEPLDEYEGISEIRDVSIDGCFTSFILEGKTYGIPLTNDFPVMFVRTDIFKQLGLSIPKTWDEVIDLSQILHRKNMSLACVPAFSSLIYQNGGKYFNDEQTKVLFEEEVAVEALDTVSKYFTLYGFPISYDFVSRFRTGEMPIGLAGYSTYVTLEYSAPEINGLWDMYTMPGTRQEDGSINYSWTDSGGTGVAMLSLANDSVKDAAWTFIRWLASTDQQTRYGNELENRLGIAGRYATVNTESLSQLNWKEKEKQVLFAQMKNIVYLPIVPGNYYITRGLNNAQRSVLYENVSPREALRKWTPIINDEIKRKRDEFSLNN